MAENKGPENPQPKVTPDFDHDVLTIPDIVYLITSELCTV